MTRPLALALIALGIVFGDIGTSPLYALNQVFAHGLIPDRLNVLGAESLIFWGLMLPITVKYVGLALRIDDNGEGGVFALYKIVRDIKPRTRYLSFLGSLIVFGAGLLYADGVITPAISVSSAVEGLNAVHPIFLKLSEPITIVILTLLFAFQKRGTALIGRWFGWAMLVWFTSIGLLGLREILVRPEVLAGLNPVWGFVFLYKLSLWKRFVALGYVMLAYTGGEALYADLGQVGASAIRLSWLGLVYPCLALNYFGQGAYLLSGGLMNPAKSLFYSIVPQPLIIPMVIVGAAATCIASQALITGAGSLTAMAASLDLMPRVRIVHTNAEQKGQVYLPFVNALLWLVCIGIVLYFGNSGRMANAYGLAVAGVMFISSLAFAVAAPGKLKWSPLTSHLVFGAFAILDGSMLIANLFKLLQGGFIPIAIGVLLFLSMLIWERGRRLQFAVERKVDSMPLREYLSLLHDAACADFVQLYLVSRKYTDLATHIPGSLHDSIVEPGYGTVSRHPRAVIFLCLELDESTSAIPAEKRFQISRMTGQAITPMPDEASATDPQDRKSTQFTQAYMVVGRYGYTDVPDLPDDLKLLQQRLGIAAPPEHWGRFVDRLTFSPGPDLSPWQWLQIGVFMAMRRLNSPLYDYYGLSKLGTVHGVRLVRQINATDMKSM